MIINLKALSKDSVTITHANPAFVGTPLATSSFSLTITDMKREDKTDILHSCVDEDRHIKEGKYQKLVFINSITAADGFIDEENQPITLERGIREIIFEYGDNLLREEINKAIRKFNEIAEKKSEEPEVL